ncbi:MAG: protein kinase [Proteobacteria bacterium]|nr:protein kinase [Pseudomonadota bacterium]
MAQKKLPEKKTQKRPASKRDPRDRSIGGETVTVGGGGALAAARRHHSGPDDQPRRHHSGPDDQLLSPGQKLGRYVILEAVGGGGMGLVYSAYDPDLDRKIAIKVLRTAALDESGPEHGSGPTRLLREAQALAQLSHPNVLPVFDVGVMEGRVFIATEFVQGRTLSFWLRQHKRKWRAVVRVFLAAGAGLEAAHRAGLVHRDFKPQNVLVSDEGSVRVMDFGLARRLDDDASVPPEAGSGEQPAPSSRDTPDVRSVSTRRSASSSDEPSYDSRNPPSHPSTGPLYQHLTQAGTVLGTLPYLAPELEQGGPASEASDQYAFCVSLYEGLYGRRPFQGHRLELSQAKAIEDYAQLPPERARQVPGWLRAIVARGLSADPGKRWPSMATLLEALAQDSRRASESSRRADTGPQTARLIDLALPVMRRLAEQSEQSCHLVVQENQRAVVVAQVDGPRFVGVLVQPGRSFYLHESASGHVIGALKSTDDRALWLRSVKARLSRKRYERFASTLERIRTQGHHVWQSTVIHGVTDLSVPVLDTGGAIAAALTVPCLPKIHTDRVAHKVVVGRVLKLLKGAASEISRALTEAD